MSVDRGSGADSAAVRHVSGAEYRAEQSLARAGVYRLLAGVYLQEIDPDVLAALREHDGFAAVTRERDERELLARLRADYARLFVMNVYPYESAYVDDEVLLNTASTQTVADAYRTVGYTPGPGRRVGALDHIGVELDLLSELAEREADHLGCGNLPAAEHVRSHQWGFLTAHLASWGPVFAASVTRDARVPLYREIGAFTADFLLADLDLLARDVSTMQRATSSHPDAGAPAPDVTPELDLRALVRRFTTPARAGFHISREELFRLAGQLELPLAPVERWLMLDQLFQAAARYGQLVSLLDGLQETAQQAVSTCATWAQVYPGAAQAIAPWAARARTTAAMLRQMRETAAVASLS